MKKYIIGAIGLIIFGTVFYITKSWKISFIAKGLIRLYLLWVIGVELGLFNRKYDKDRIEENYQTEKRRYSKKTNDNPTLR